MTQYSRYERAVDDAEKKGCVVVVPGPRELFVDIDDGPSWDVFCGNFERLREVLPMSKERRPSPSGAEGRYHVVVTLERDLESPYERILLQTLLGSDRTREALSYQRAVRGDPVPTLFFEKRGGPHDPGGSRPSKVMPERVGDEELPF